MRTNIDIDGRQMEQALKYIDPDFPLLHNGKDFDEIAYLTSLKIYKD